MDTLINWLKEAEHAVVFTGAGMSTENGLPDFRSSQGLWKTKDPSQLASPEALNRYFEDFTSFYKQRIVSVKEYGPHQGHDILAKWERLGLIQSIITQNVDGFHHMAGSERVAELHGTLRKVHCETCKKEYDNAKYIHEAYHCNCGGTLRPSVVLFGEMLPQDAFQFASEESKKADLFLVLGSSLSVSPANQLPLLARENGAKLVIMNMDETEMDHAADQVIHGRKIGDWLTELDQQL